MNVSKRFLAAGLGLAAVLAAGAAQARSDVHWSVSIGGPIPIAIHSPAPRIVYHPPVLLPRPVAVAPGWGDRDRDGVPNRYDRSHTPRWDRDGDGIPNRYDRHPRHADNRYNDRGPDRGHDSRGRDRDDDHRGNGRGGRGGRGD